MASMQRIGKTATSVRVELVSDCLSTHVRYHDTDVVIFSEDSIRLDSGGWRTATTKVRMNQTANAYGLGFQVYQAKGAWFVRYLPGRADKSYPFVDGICIDRLTGEVWPDKTQPSQLAQLTGAIRPEPALGE